MERSESTATSELQAMLGDGATVLERQVIRRLEPSEIGVLRYWFDQKTELTERLAWCDKTIGHLVAMAARTNDGDAKLDTTTWELYRETEPLNDAP